MRIPCDGCGRTYEARLFERDRVVLCECGRWVEPEGRLAERVRRRERTEGRTDVEDLARRADRITSLVLYSDLPQVDIEIEIDKLREFCRERFADRMDLFEMVYAGRWRRLREQGWARGSGWS